MEVAPAETQTVAGAGPSPPHRLRPPWIAPVAVGAAALAGCVAVGLLNPVEEGRPAVCPFKLMTGLDCPGCGATRATNALLRGHPMAAIDQNALLVLLLPVVVLAYAAWTLRSVGVSVPTAPRLRRWAPALIILVLAFWALRLLPWAPVAWMASGRS